MKQDSWYWVRIKGEWYPAMYDELSCGGWTNADTWEDFDYDVDLWKIMTPPNTASTRLLLLARKIKLLVSVRKIG